MRLDTLTSFSVADVFGVGCCISLEIGAFFLIRNFDRKGILS